MDTYDEYKMLMKRRAELLKEIIDTRLFTGQRNHKAVGELTRLYEKMNALTQRSLS